MNGLYNSFPFVCSESLPFVPSMPGSGGGGGGGGGGSDAQAWELYPYSLGETESAITRNGTPGTNASGWRGFANICPRNFTARYMSVAIRNTGGLYMRLGIFDAAGNRLSLTERFPPVANTIITAQLVADVPLQGQRGYYLGYWTDDTTGNIQFSCLSGRSVSNRAPLMQRCDPNELAGNISAAFPFTSLRPWLAVFE